MVSPEIVQFNPEAKEEDRRRKQLMNDKARSDVYNQLSVREMEGDDKFYTSLKALKDSLAQLQTAELDHDVDPKPLALALAVVEKELEKLKETKRGSAFKKLGELEAEVGKQPEVSSINKPLRENADQSKGYHKIEAGEHREVA